MDWRNAPSLAALRGFEAAARHGSLSRAAAELNVTHAAIAQHVRTVEDFIGQPLLVREGRGMAMTGAGAALQPDLTAGFSRILDSVIEASRVKDDGPLRVATTPSFAEHWLMPRLVRFWQDHPNIAVSITPGIEVIDLRRDGFDIALRYGRGDWPGLDSVFLVAADYIVAAAPQLTAQKPTGSIAALSHYTWLNETRFGEALRWARAKNIPLDQLDTRDVGESSLVLAATRAGAGVSVQSRTLIAADLAAGTLVPVFEADPEVGVGYHIVTRPGHVSDRIRVFSKWLRQAV